MHTAQIIEAEGFAHGRRTVEFAALNERPAIVDGDFGGAAAVSEIKLGAEIEAAMLRVQRGAGHSLGVVALAGACGIVVLRHDAVAGPVGRGHDGLRPAVLRKENEAKHRREAARQHLIVRKASLPSQPRNGIWPAQDAKERAKAIRMVTRMVCVPRGLPMEGEAMGTGKEGQDRFVSREGVPFALPDSVTRPAGNCLINKSFGMGALPVICFIKNAMGFGLSRQSRRRSRGHFSGICRAFGPLSPPQIIQSGAMSIVI